VSINSSADLIINSSIYIISIKMAMLTKKAIRLNVLC